MHTLTLAQIAAKRACRKQGSSEAQSIKETNVAMIFRVLFRPKALPRRVAEVFAKCDAEFDALSRNLDKMSDGPP